MTFRGLLSRVAPRRYLPLSRHKPLAAIFTSRTEILLIYVASLMAAPFLSRLYFSAPDKPSRRQQRVSISYFGGRFTTIKPHNFSTSSYERNYFATFSLDEASCAHYGRDATSGPHFSKCHRILVFLADRLASDADTTLIDCRWQANISDEMNTQCHCLISPHVSSAAYHYRRCFEASMPSITHGQRLPAARGSSISPLYLYRAPLGSMPNTGKMRPGINTGADIFIHFRRRARRARHEGHSAGRLMGHALSTAQPEIRQPPAPGLLSGADAFSKGQRSMTICADAEAPTRRHSLRCSHSSKALSGVKALIMIFRLLLFAPTRRATIRLGFLR